MCGIAGIVGPLPREAREEAARRMSLRLVHRGPDADGAWSDDAATLVHRRLSILDLSPAAHQPMVRGNAVVAFNGEIYNHAELRKLLEAEGAAFRTRSDTEVLLEGYRTWGEAFVERLDGMFAFALWDAGSRRLLCARDPFGKKPFYYHLAAGVFRFASELPALSQGLPRTPDLDLASLGGYLLKGYFEEGRTPFASVLTLEPGTAAVFDARTSSLAKTRVFPTAFASPAADAAGDAVPRLEASIAAAVSCRLQADVPVGVFLSGGVDSSLITLLAAAGPGPRVRTFTATFPGTMMDEARYASQVAEKAGSEHAETPMAALDIAGLLPKLAYAYGEPFGDVSAISTYSLFGAVPSFAKVILTGDGGDELFAGYKDVRLFLFRAQARFLHGAGDAVPDRWLLPLLCARRPALRQLGHAAFAMRKDGADAYCSLYREGWTSNWRRAVLRPDAFSRTGGDGPEIRERAAFREAGDDDIVRYLNRRLERLRQCFVTKIDRASMAFSIEARSPLLSYSVFKETRALPHTTLLSGGRPKSLLKALVDRRMGSGFSARPKMGFTPPLAQWLRSRATADWASEVLRRPDSLAAELMAPQGVEALLKRHRAGEDHSGRIWKMLFLTEWHSETSGLPRPEPTGAAP